MTATFEFATATRIRFGRGAVADLPGLVAQLGQFILVVTGFDSGRADPTIKALRDRNLSLTTYSVKGEPTTESVAKALEIARKTGATAVVAIGGGSVIDLGKAVATLLTNCDDLSDYLEVIGRGRPIEERSAPFAAVPTTAGTGAEVTRNAVIRSEEHGVKISLRSAHMLPELALIDPELSLSMPPQVTASTGLDAMTQLIEPFVSVASNPLTDALCREGLSRAARSLRRAFMSGTDLDAREDMCLASLFGGLALANAKLGAVHGFAAPIGGVFPKAAHGVICARILPLVMETNIRALKERLPDSPALPRYRELARIMTGESSATAVDGIHWVQSLCTGMQIPPLQNFGLTENHYEDLIEKARKASSMHGNPIKLTRPELTGILRKAVEGH